MNYSRECLYDVEWQKLRVKCLGKWQHEAGVKQCLNTLWLYWGRQGDGKAERVWRVLNLLNAVKLGWSQNPSGMPGELGVELVREASIEASRVYTKLGMEMASEWDWNTVRQDLMSLGQADLRAIQSNLARRAAMAKRRLGSDERVRETRAELVFFLEMLDQEGMRREGHHVRCLARVAEKLSPYHRVFRGFRITTCVPNMVGYKPFSSERVPSFERPYHLVTFGDFETGEALQAALPRVKGEMSRRGFDEVQWLTLPEEMQHEEPAKA